MAAKQPNILIIFTDQQNIDTIAAYRHHFSHEAHSTHWVKTPNLDRMAENGYSFLESHSCNPVSSPARSCTFTGRYSTETGITYNNVGIDKDVPNMGQWFERHSNYDRVYCGKWHAGGKWNYPDIDGNRKIPGFDTIPVSVWGTGDFNDFQVAGAIRAYIQNHDYDTPFLAVAGLMNPHDICYWTPGLWGSRLVADHDLFKLGEKLPPLPPNYQIGFEDPEPRSQHNKKTEIQWKNYIYDYLRMIEKLDADLGRMLEAVDNRRDDTLVVLTADHGEGAGRHRRVQKWHPFEQSVKVPLVYYMPGRVKKNVIDTENIVSQVHLMPTLCDYAGIPAPPDGLVGSLKNLIETGETEEALDFAISEFKHVARVVRYRDFKYVKYYEYSGIQDEPFVRSSDGKPEKFTPCAGKERYRESGRMLLFNIREDPWEQTDLSRDPDYADKIDELENVLINRFEMVVRPGTHFDRN